jgi:hypothetical protein
VSSPKEIEHALQEGMTRNGKIPLAIKWSGTAFYRQEPIKFPSVYESMFDEILEHVGPGSELAGALKRQFRVSVKKQIDVG